MLHGPFMIPHWAKITLKVVGSLTVSVCLLVTLIGSVNTIVLSDILRQARWPWLLAAAGLVPLQVLLAGLRWQRVAADLGMSLTRRRAVSEYALSTLGNQVLPGGVTGDAVRVYRHKQGHGALPEPLQAAVLERGIGHCAHLVVTVIGLLLWPTIHHVAAPPYCLTLVLMLMTMMGVLWWRPIRGLRTLVSNAHQALETPEQWGFHSIISLSLVGTFLIGFSFCAFALDLPLGSGVFTAVPLLMLIMIIPLSVGGWGLRELSATAVLTTLGWSAESALALSGVYGFTCLMGSIPGALVFVDSIWGQPS